MKIKTWQTLLISNTFVWVGLIIGLSFVETPLKFQTPGISRELALGLGKIIFTALNRIEWLLSLLVIACLCFLKDSINHRLKLVYSSIILIVVVQTFFLLPELNHRVDMILSGNQPPKSIHHTLFAVLEVSKLLLLSISGWVYTRNIIH